MVKIPSVSLCDDLVFLTVKIKVIFPDVNPSCVRTKRSITTSDDFNHRWTSGVLSVIVRFGETYDFSWLMERQAWWHKSWEKNRHSYFTSTYSLRTRNLPISALLLISCKYNFDPVPVVIGTISPGM